MKLMRFLPLPLITLALVANASADSGKRGGGFQLTGKVVAPPAQIDLGGPGPSAGDQTVITMDLFKGATRVGESHVLCTVVRFDPATKFTITQCQNVNTING